MDENTTRVETVSERIARVYPDMSDALQQFANLVLSEPLAVARDSMQEAVQRVGVSVATANRFARALGYSGYAEFRSELIRGFEAVFSTVDRLETSLKSEGTPFDIMSGSLAKVQANLETTQMILTPAMCEDAVRLILGAKRRFVLGFERAAHLGAILASELDIRCGNTSSMASSDGAVGAIMRLNDYGGDDLVIAIAFPRYFRETIELARFAKKRGVKLLAITDSPRSPLAALADVSVYVHSERGFGANSDSTVLAVMEALVAAVTHRVPNALARYRSFTEAILPWCEVPARDKSGPF